MCNLALDAVQTVTTEVDGKKEIDTKRHVKIEKIPGGEIEDSQVIKGVIMNKDVTHPKMRRRIENPRIVLLDCPLEYQKAESQININIEKEEDWKLLLKQEEEYVEKMCNDIIKFKPDIVITEKGLSDLAQHFFVKHNITALRRLRKTDNNRIARCTGATIVNRPEELQETDIGTRCGLFEIRKIGDEYFSFITECKGAQACTILLRGASKDVLNEIERNLQDALCVARNVYLDPKLVPGGGASEMSVTQALLEKSKTIEGVVQYPYRSVALAFEVIPRTLAQNCGSKTVRVVTELRAKHASNPVENSSWGIDGDKGVIGDMKSVGIWEPLSVKSQTFKTALEAACLLLRVDVIVSGISKKDKNQTGGQMGGVPEEMD
jgi:T-complex protein 1 subunit gamma